jgi:hypothetical protein
MRLLNKLEVSLQRFHFLFHFRDLLRTPATHCGWFGSRFIQEQEAWREAQWRKQEEAEALAAVRELAEDASKSEGSSDYAAKTGQAVPEQKCVTCGVLLPKGTKYVWQGRNRWCERCFWGEDPIAKVPAESGVSKKENTDVNHGINREGD